MTGTNGRVAACTRDPAHMHRHAYVCMQSVTYTLHAFTHLLDTLILGFSTVSTFHWPYLTEGPTAFNQLGHEALQMGLSVGWDRCGRGKGGLHS